MDGQVGYWIRAVLEEASYDNDEDEEVVQEITNTLKVESVKGRALLLLTSDDMKDMKIPVGPRKVLENRIAAVSKATAKAGFFWVVGGHALSPPDGNLAGSPRSAVSRACCEHFREQEGLSEQWALGCPEFAALRAVWAVQLLLLPLLAALPRGRRAFSCGPTVCFLGSCSPLSKDPLVVKLHCVGLQQFGEREGLSEQRALGCFRFMQIWLPFVFCRCFRTGCQS